MLAQLIDLLADFGAQPVFGRAVRHLLQLLLQAAPLHAARHSQTGVLSAVSSWQGGTM